MAIVSKDHGIAEIDIEAFANLGKGLPVLEVGAKVATLSLSQGIRKINYGTIVYVIPAGISFKRAIPEEFWSLYDLSRVTKMWTVRKYESYAIACPGLNENRKQVVHWPLPRRIIPILS